MYYSKAMRGVDSAVVAVGLVAVVALGCGATTGLASSDAGAGADVLAGAGPFEGTWDGSAAVAATPFDPPGATQRFSVPMRFQVASGPGDGVTVTLGDLVGGMAPGSCSVGARRGGDLLMFDRNATCRGAGSPGATRIDLVVVQGHASLMGGALRVELEVTRTIVQATSTGTRTTRDRSFLTFTGSRS